MTVSKPEVPREERLGCFGWVCAVLGITPARVRSAGQRRREAESVSPRVIRTDDDARLTEGTTPEQR
jgi:hypothetical protein